MVKVAVKRINKKKNKLKKAVQNHSNITMDSKTGLLVDTKTGQTYDPKTGEPVTNQLQARFGTTLTSGGLTGGGYHTSNLGYNTYSAQQAYSLAADEARRHQQEEADLKRRALEEKEKLKTSQANIKTYENEISKVKDPLEEAKKKEEELMGQVQYLRKHAENNKNPVYQALRLKDLTNNADKYLQDVNEEYRKLRAAETALANKKKQEELYNFTKNRMFNNKPLTKDEELYNASLHQEGAISDPKIKKMLELGDKIKNNKNYHYIYNVFNGHKLTKLYHTKLDELNENDIDEVTEGFDKLANTINSNNGLKQKLNFQDTSNNFVLKNSNDRQTLLDFAGAFGYNTGQVNEQAFENPYEDINLDESPPEPQQPEQPPTIENNQSTPSVPVQVEPVSIPQPINEAKQPPPVELTNIDRPYNPNTRSNIPSIPAPPPAPPWAKNDPTYSRIAPPVPGPAPQGPNLPHGRYPILEDPTRLIPPPEPQPQKKHGFFYNLFFTDGDDNSNKEVNAVIEQTKHDDSTKKETEKIINNPLPQNLTNSNTGDSPVTFRRANIIYPNKEEQEIAELEKQKKLFEKKQEVAKAQEDYAKQQTSTEKSEYELKEQHAELNPSVGRKIVNGIVATGKGVGATVAGTYNLGKTVATDTLQGVKNVADATKSVASAVKDVGEASDSAVKIASNIGKLNGRMIGSTWRSIFSQTKEEKELEDAKREAELKEQKEKSAKLDKSIFENTLDGTEQFLQKENNYYKLGAETMKHKEAYAKSEKEIFDNTYTDAQQKAINEKIMAEIEAAKAKAQADKEVEAKREYENHLGFFDKVLHKTKQYSTFHSELLKQKEAADEAKANSAKHKKTAYENELNDTVKKEMDKERTAKANANTAKANAESAKAKADAAKDKREQEKIENPGWFDSFGYYGGRMMDGFGKVAEPIGKAVGAAASIFAKGG